MCAFFAESPEIRRKVEIQRNDGPWLRYYIETLFELIKLGRAFIQCYDWLGFNTELLVDSPGIPFGEHFL